MDIQISSNFERYLFEASGRNAAFVRASMEGLKQSRRFELRDVAERARSDFKAASASQADVAHAIRDLRERAGYLLDPHTACGVVAAGRTGQDRDPSVPEIILATAHPAKFPDAMEEITGQRPGLPQRLDSLMSDEERYDVLDNALDKVEAYVEERSRAVGRGAPA